MRSGKWYWAVWGGQGKEHILNLPVLSIKIHVGYATSAVAGVRNWHYTVPVCFNSFSGRSMGGGVTIIFKAFATSRDSGAMEFFFFRLNVNRVAWIMPPFYCVGLGPSGPSRAHPYLLSFHNPGRGVRIHVLLTINTADGQLRHGGVWWDPYMHAATLFSVLSQMVPLAPAKCWRERAVAAGLYPLMNGDGVVCWVWWWGDGGDWTGLVCFMMGMPVMGGVHGRKRALELVYYHYMHF